MVERLHPKLMAALVARLDREHWVDRLSMGLLGLCAVLRRDLGCLAAELVFGAPLRLSRDLFVPSPPLSQPLQYLQHVQDCIHHLRPVPPRSSDRHVFMHPDVASSTRRLLPPSYNGPYRVLNKTKKLATILLNGCEEVVSLDGLKPAYLETPPQVLPLDVASLSADQPAAKAAPSLPHRRVHFAVPSGRGAL
ncbi:uncharacterized protein LOC144112121 [Amblyomma americanum]